MTQPILVLDTVGAWCAAALKVGDQVFELAEEIGRGHAERLAPMVEDLLLKAGLNASALWRIGVNVGPGSFAGARVGVAFARGLALSTGAQPVGVGLLPALALRACPKRDRAVFAIHDAKRGEYLWSIYAPGQAEAPIERGVALAAQDAVKELPHPLITGSGAPIVEGPAFDARPPLAELLALTLEASADVPPPAPVYARPPDAKPSA